VPAAPCAGEEVDFMPQLVFLVPVVGMIATATVIIGWVGILYAQKRRELLSRERLAAIEKGLDVPVLDAPSPQRRMNPLQSALLLMAAGAGLEGAAVLQHGYATSPVMGLGIILMFIGMAQLAYWFLGGRMEWERQRALDEELRRAYIARLQNASSLPPSNNPSAV
jgi:uncharacterized protein DUF6249